MRHILLTLVMLFLVSVPVNAEVLASVGDKTFTYDELVTMIGGEENLQYLGIASEGDAVAILDSWVSEELLIQSAENAGLENEPTVLAAIEEARRQILLEAYLTLITEDIQQPSQLEIMTYAGTWEDTYCKEVNLQHILIQDENLANSLLARLNSGEDFAEIAMQYSVGPSGPSGGELGWITRGQSGFMVFDEVAFRLETGEISAVFETSAGFHIVKAIGVEEISPAPTTEEILNYVGQELYMVSQEAALIEVLDGLKAEYNIQIYPERLMGHL